MVFSCLSNINYCSTEVLISQNNIFVKQIEYYWRRIIQTKKCVVKLYTFKELRTERILNNLCYFSFSILIPKANVTIRQPIIISGRYIFTLKYKTTNFTNICSSYFFTPFLWIFCCKIYFSIFAHIVYC